MNVLLPSTHMVNLQHTIGGCKMPALVLNTEEVISAWEQIGGDIYSDAQQLFGSNVTENGHSATADDTPAVSVSLPPFIPSLSSFLAPAQPIDPFNWTACNAKFPLHAPFMLPLASSPHTTRLPEFPFPKMDFSAPITEMQQDTVMPESKPACSGSSLSSGSDIALVPDATSQLSPPTNSTLPSSPAGIISQTVKLLPVVPPPLAGPKVAGDVEVRSRKECLERYKEKKARRLYTKKIRYQLRKINADRRPRIKGRFVKKEELEEYLKQQACGTGSPVVDDLDESDYEEDEDDEEDEAH